jgi:hypothetical protein
MENKRPPLSALQHVYISVSLVFGIAASVYSAPILVPHLPVTGLDPTFYYAGEQTPFPEV